MYWVFIITFVGGLVLYFMTPDERSRLLRACIALLNRRWAEVVRRWTRQPGDDGSPAPPLAFATAAIALATVLTYVRMRFAGAALGDPETLVAWGGSFGPRTTNGEWWRLFSAMFVHGGALHLVVMLAGLIQIAALTERLVGRLAIVAVYVAGGVVATLVCLFTTPVTVTIGASGAVFGVYGLLAATWTWGLLRGPRVRISQDAAKRLVPGLALFLLYDAVTGRLGHRAAIAAFTAGTIIGLLLTRGARDHRPALRRVALLSGATAIVVVFLAVPLRGMADVRPAIDRVIVTEDRTSAAYEAAVARFNINAITAPALVQVIDRRIVPELESTRAAVDALQRVPYEHQRLVALAGEYLRLRGESWRLRSEGLRTLKMRTLQEAKRKEWQALEALRKVRDTRR